jgi:hypothetical protein
MEHHGDPSQSAALSLLAGLTLRDLEEVEARVTEPTVISTDDLREKRLASVLNLFKAVQRGAHPLYARTAGVGGGSLMAKTDLHAEVASLDDDVEMFMLAARLRDGEQPDEISGWAKRCEQLVQALIDGDFSGIDEEDRRRLTQEVRFFLNQLERLDEIRSDRPAHELL